MKAIHNKRTTRTAKSRTVFIPTKIQNESNSQLNEVFIKLNSDCIYPYKDTK